MLKTVTYYTIIQTNTNNTISNHRSRLSSHFVGSKFYFEHILRLPATKSEEAAYGTAVHNTLSRIFITAKRNSNSMPEIATVLDFFIFEIGKQRINLTEKSYGERIESGKIKLTKYYKSRKWNTNCGGNRQDDKKG